MSGAVCGPHFARSPRDKIFLHIPQKFSPFSLFANSAVTFQVLRQFAVVRETNLIMDVMDYKYSASSNSFLAANISACKRKSGSIPAEARSLRAFYVKSHRGESFARHNQAELGPDSLFASSAVTLRYLLQSVR